MGSGTKDNFARTMGVLSFIVALAAVIVPYFQQKSHLENLQQEELKVILNPAVDGPLILTSHDYGEQGRVIQMPWQLTISNTGNRQLSIISKRLSRGETPDSVFYTGIDGGIVTEDFKPLKLPLKLESGESKSYYLYVGTMVPKQVFEILYNINEGKPVSDRAAMKVLGEHGMDIYGNKVEYHGNENGKVSIIFKEADKSPTFWLRLSTGKGNNFFASGAKYHFAPELIL